MKKLIILTLSLGLTFATFAQSPTVESFEETADGYKVFLYQSLIRVLNKDKNPDFNMLIRNLDHLRFVTTDSTGDAAVNKFVSLDKGIQGEGFEEIMTFDNKEYKCHIYELESKGGTTSWVATMFMQGRVGLIEMKGSLDMKYIHAFNSLNMDKLQEMLPMEEIKKWD